MSVIAIATSWSIVRIKNWEIQHLLISIHHIAFGHANYSESLASWRSLRVYILGLLRIERRSTGCKVCGSPEVLRHVVRDHANAKPLRVGSELRDRELLDQRERRHQGCEFGAQSRGPSNGQDCKRYCVDSGPRRTDKAQSPIFLAVLG